MKGNRFEINGVVSGDWMQIMAANIGVGWVASRYTKKTERVRKMWKSLISRIKNNAFSWEK